jgi:hypothetical protein
MSAGHLYSGEIDEKAALAHCAGGVASRDRAGIG